MQELETLRDLKVITSWSTDTRFAERYTESRNKTLAQIDRLLKITDNKNNSAFLTELKKQIELDEKAQGIEAGSIDAVYEDAQSILVKVYNWRAKLSYSFISFGRNNNHILTIINLLNETDIYTRAMGKARTYGSLYLAQKFVDSYGGQMLEKTYQELNSLVDVLDLKNTEYRPFFKAYPQADLNNIGASVKNGRELFYQQLIFATDMRSDAQDYFDQISQSFASFYQYNQSLFYLSASLVEDDYLNSLKQLWVFYLSALFMALLIVYLALGIYHSISITVSELRKSAAAFASGKYDRPVNIICHDEMTAVAQAMDSMRLKIKEREEKLALMSQTDGLTKLPNRKFFDQALDISLANSRRNMTPLTLVMMDIDYFKKVIDQYGHLAGDDCLIHIARLIKRQYQRQTDVVARYGGEEFIAILYGQDLEEAKAQTEKLRKKIESTTITSGKLHFKVTASFGLASLIPPTEDKPNELIALADALLYQSKDNGRNRITGENFQ